MPGCLRSRIARRQFTELGHGALPIVDLGQAVLGLLDVDGHALAHHLRQIITRPRLRGVRQAGQQRQPLDLIRIAAGQHVSVRGVRLSGEVGDLGCGDPLQHRGHLAQSVHPLQVRGLVLELRPGRPPRRFLQPVQITLAVRPRHQQRLQARLPVPAQPDPDLLKDLRGRHLSRRLERDLLGAGERIVRVPPKLMAHARDGARSYGKSDPIDALAVARAALRRVDLPPLVGEVRQRIDLLLAAQDRGRRCGRPGITGRSPTM